MDPLKSYEIGKKLTNPQSRSDRFPLAPTQRQVRILELRNYAEKNFNSIFENAEREIREEGWIPADDEKFKADLNNQPYLIRRNMSYRRPWGDFLLILTQRAQDWYYVTQETAKSYARAALQPFVRDLLAKKWKEDPRKKWDYKLTLLKRGVSYSCKFPCPKCNKEAREREDFGDGQGH